MSKIFLWVSAAVWLPYGVACFFAPSLLNNGGVAASNATGSTEIRAMYGGLQIGIGVLCVLGATRPEWTSTALRTLLVLGAGLLSTRTLGVLLDSSMSGYTAGALFFEAITVAIAAKLAGQAA